MAQEVAGGSKPSSSLMVSHDPGVKLNDQQGACLAGHSLSDRSGMHGWRLAAVFFGLAMAMFVSSLSETIAATALPTIVGDLGGVKIMQWVSTTYILASTVTMPIYGKLGDKIGRKHLLVVAMGLYAVGKAMCGLTPNMAGLICGRAVSGLGGGGLIILSQAVLADVVSARARGKYMGAIGAVFAVANVLGPVLGGWFVEVAGWRMIFWFTVPLAIVAMVVIGVFLPKDAKSSKARVDYWGMALLTLSAVSIVLATSWAGDLYPWLSWQIIGLLVFALGCAGGFVLVEKSTAEPVIPLWLFKDRNFVLVTLCGMMVYASFDGVINYLPTYLQIVTDKSPEIAGLMMTPIMAGSLLTSTVTGFLASATGKYKWMLVSMGVVTSVGFFLMGTVSGHTPIILMLIYFFVIGFGLGLGSQILVLVVQNEFPHAIVGTATAANNFFRQIGSTLGTAIVGTLFTTRLAEYVGGKIPSDLHVSLSTLTPDVFNKLPHAVQAIVAAGYHEALIPLFLYLMPLLVAAAILVLFVKQKPLSEQVDNTGFVDSATKEPRGSHAGFVHGGEVVKCAADTSVRSAGLKNENPEVAPLGGARLSNVNTASMPPLAGGTEPMANKSSGAVLPGKRS